MEEIRNLVAKGKLKQAIERALIIANNSGDNDLMTEVNLLSSRNSTLERDARLGTISRSEEQLERNKIVAALLDFANRIGNISTNPGAANANTSTITGDGNIVIQGASNSNINIGTQPQTAPPPTNTPGNTSPESGAKNVFISYAHKDTKYKENLDTFLKIYERNRKIKVWSDDDILPGASWETEINRNLQRADIILLLLSPDFLASDYIWDTELPIVEQRHRSGAATVIPILLRDCGWADTPYSRIQAVPMEPKTRQLKPISNWENEDMAWKIVTDGIKRVLEK